MARASRSSSKQDPREQHGPELVGHVRDVTQGGEAVVETSEGVVLTRGALPGEQVRVQVQSRRQGVLRGKLKAVLVASAQRVTPSCALAERCGGCPLMSLDIAAQRALKLEHVARALTGVEAPGLVLVMENAGEPLGYRRRVRMAFRRVGSLVLVGYRSADSHTIVDVSSCGVLEPALEQALALVREHLAPQLVDAGEIDLAKAEPGRVVVSVQCDAPVAAQAYRAAEALCAHALIAGVALRVAGGAAATFGEVEASSVAPDGAVLHAPADGFAQSNRIVNQRLVELVVELSQPRAANVLELYAGHGNFTVALAPLASTLCAIEADAAAAAACRRNLQARGFSKVRVLASDAAEAGRAAARSERADVLVLDPPRSGAPALRAIVERHQPARIVYVSCHMTTLARDLRVLAELGYRADRAHALDMFPHTAHVEAVVRLVRDH